MSNHRTDHLKRFAAMFAALSNPNRLRIFQRLVACCRPGTACDAGAPGCHCVGDLGEGLDIAPSTLSHHIKELQRAGLINMERRGQRVECWVSPDLLRELADFFDLSCCG
ncbi:MAG: ArsR/SmtB family transcription factor [Planctomycetota bacterium]